MKEKAEATEAINHEMNKLVDVLVFIVGNNWLKVVRANSNYLQKVGLRRLTAISTTYHTVNFR